MTDTFAVPPQEPAPQEPQDDWQPVQDDWQPVQKEDTRSWWERGAVKPTMLTTDPNLKPNPVTDWIASSYVKAAAGIGDDVMQAFKQPPEEMKRLPLWQQVIGGVGDTAGGFASLGKAALGATGLPMAPAIEAGMSGLSSGLAGGFTLGNWLAHKLGQDENTLPHYDRVKADLEDQIGMAWWGMGSPHWAARPKGQPFAPPQVMRAKPRPDGGVDVQAVGELPKDEDFKTSADLIAKPPGEFLRERLGLTDQPPPGADPADSVLNRLSHDPNEAGEERAWYRLRQLYPERTEAQLQPIADEIKSRLQNNAAEPNDGFDASTDYWHGTTHGRFTVFRDSTLDDDVLGPAAYLSKHKAGADFYGPGRGGDLLGPFRVRGNIVTPDTMVPWEPGGEKMARAIHVLGKLRGQLIGGRFEPWGEGLTPAQYTREFWKRRGVDGYDSGAGLEVAIYDPANIRADFDRPPESAPSQVEENLRRMWDEDGVHPAEAVHDAKSDAFLAQEIKGPPSFDADHASPHDFDRFDLSKAGTGEGAQYRGYGIYLSENEGVHSHYLKQFTSRKIGGKEFDLEDPTHWAAGALKMEGSRDEAIARLEDKKLFLSEKTGPIIDQAVELLRSGVDLPAASASVSYRVRVLADRSNMLDGDLPINEQPRIVQEFVRSHGLTKTALGERASESGDKIYDALKSKLATNKKLPPDKNDMYRFDDGREAASNLLNNAGIHGIKFLDEQSRHPPLRWDVLNEEENRAIRLIGSPRAPDVTYDTERKSPAEAYDKTLRYWRSLMTNKDGELYNPRDAAAAQAIDKILASGKTAPDPGPRTYNYVIFDGGAIQITHKNGVPMTPTKVAPVRNSPIPEGTPRTELARTGEAHIDAVLDNPVVRRNIDSPVIDDTYDVPYSAGGSVPAQDPTTFIDRHFPRSMEIDGVRFDPADPFVVHENVEQHVMDELIKGREPPVPKGMTRLYRGETDFPREPKKPLPEWLQGDKTVEGNIAAEGRWFVRDRETADYYNKTFGDKTGRVSYVDVPTSDIDKYLSANQPEVRHFSAAGRDAEEYFVPKEIAASRQPIGMDPQTAYRVSHFEFAEKAEGAWYRAHGIDQAKAEAAYQPFIDAIQHRMEEPPERAVPAIKYNPLEMARKGELSAAKAGEISKEYAAKFKEMEDSVLGKDADAWREAHKRSYRYWDSGYQDEEARAQDKIFSDIEAKHPQSAIENLYGDFTNSLEQGNGHVDPESWKTLARDLKDVEGDRSEALTAVSEMLRRLPKTDRPLRDLDREILAVIQHALNEETKRGGDQKEFLRDAFIRSAKRYGGGPDAKEIVTADIEHLRKLMENPPSALPRPATSSFNPPPNLYRKPYPHDDVNAAEGEPLAEPGPSKEEIARAKEILNPELEAAKRENDLIVREVQAAQAALNSAGADVTRPENLPSLAQQPPPRPGALMTVASDAADKLFDIGRDLQMKLAPMATGTRDSMAIAKDFANALRRNRWEWDRIDSDLAKRFAPEQRKRMWDAADEESVLRQDGQTSENMGLATLEPEERAVIEDLHARAEMAWLRAVDMGMVEGDGLPAYTPRMVINAASAGGKDMAVPLNGIGTNLRTRTTQMMRRKYLTAEETEAAAKAALGDTAEIARDIRALPLAIARMEDAIAGRSLIDNIKEVGKRAGEDTVSEGGKPVDSEHTWFTIDHPAFRTWKPRLEEIEGKVQAARDAEGNIIFDQVPIYVRGDFEGPLRAVLSQKSGAIYGALMSLKGKTMGLIMNSPLIHNAVEWGRAVASMPGKVATFKIYFEGNAAKHGVSYDGPVQHIRNWWDGKLEAFGGEAGRNISPTMLEAIDAGLVPIGKRFFNQDIDSIMEEPNLAPGRSWTSQVARFVPDLFDPAAPGQTVGGAGDKVAAAIDRAGDFWHNTLLWDRVADLQMGLYVNFRDSLIAKGVDAQTSARAAAHFANRYAGALPQEAMSANARKISNFLLFSRSFTLGNLGVMKDMLTGLPKDVMAQIERDTGTVDPKAADFAKSMARRKAMAVVALDIGMMYVFNSILQSASNVLRDDSTLDQEMQGYARRLSEAMTEVKENPLKLLFPIPIASAAIDFANHVSSTYENEPGKQDRIRIGYAKDGTAIYARNPVGKIGEEFVGYLTGPFDMLRRKMGTIARPAYQIFANDKGFGRKVYDPDADTPAKQMGVIRDMAAHFFASQLPEGQINALSDLVKGEGDARVNEAQAFGPIAGVTFSKGAPGGPAIGDLYHAKAMHQYAIDAALPDIRKQIQRGDVTGAQSRMQELGIPPGLQRFYIRTSLTPSTRLSGRTLRDFYQYATPQQRERLERAQTVH